MIDGIYRVKDRHTRLLRVSAEICTPRILLTGTRIIQPSVPCVPLIQITKNNIPIAPTIARIRKNNCSHRTYLTFSLVRGLIGFQLRLPYGLWRSAIIVTNIIFNLHNQIWIWMFVELPCINQWPFLLWPWLRRSPACLCCSSWIEASFAWACKGKSGWIVVEKGRVDPHLY